MKTFISLVISCTFATSSIAQNGQDGNYNYVDLCSINGDKWSLEPSKEFPGEYIFSYTNSIHKCSQTYGGRGLVASDGFRVILYVIAGYNGTENELVYVVPEDPAYMSIPAELNLPDSSEPGIIRIIPGIS